MASSSCVPGLNLPSGFKFLPTNQELLGYYLLNKVCGKPFKYDSRVMNNFNIYKMEPCELWNRFGGPRLTQDEDLFFFTELKKVNDNGSNFCRVTGSGTWKGDTTGAKVYDSEDKTKILGSWKRFHYMSNEPNENGSWIMLEYKLDDSLIPKSCSDRDLVLCRIRKDRKRKIIEEQMKDTPQFSRRKVPRVDKHVIRPVLNNNTNQPAYLTGCSASEEEQQRQRQRQQDPQFLASSSLCQEQQQQLLDNELMIPSDHYIFKSEGAYDPMNIVQPSPSSIFSQLQNNLGVPSYYLDQQQQELFGNDPMVSSHQDNFQSVNYLVSTTETQTLNNENPMDSSFTRWLSSDEVKPNNTCEGQQTSASFEHEDQQLRQQDQQVLPSTSHCHKQEQQNINNHMMVSSADDQPNIAQPNPDTLISHQPNHHAVPTEIDESQNNHSRTFSELLVVGTGNDPYTAVGDSIYSGMGLSDNDALTFSSLDDNVFDDWN
ncbi:NAC domain-containing protein 37-like [Argentina anserina]|uniref:NAC domain-containing protein 37-like n=1 Tax=Argentina anserina TaxID=57926 RepID=UPI0021768DE6|nr:NAC domain-containing protein 37-like [Potentilla anserina]